VSIELSDLITDLKFNTPPKIYFKDPVAPDELLQIAATFDIGFATEPGFCVNNKIALSNKIFTYLVGGNAIIFSNTPAQKHFYDQYPDIGFIYNSHDTATLAELIRKYAENKFLLEEHKQNSKKLFLNDLNWDKEQETLLKRIKKELNQGS
jgi:hypothetical protein